MDTDSYFSLSFLQNGGAMGAAMRGMDWSESPLGPPDRWSSSLRTVVGLMLNSKFPMFIAWGPELGFLYNDSYSEILGDKHPQALGRRFQDIWAEIWDDILPSIERALAGEATYHENLPLLMHRHGYDEQTWFTFSYSPVRDESGEVAGMHCACVETTQQVLHRVYRDQENERFRTLFSQAPGFMAILRGPDHVFELTNQAYHQVVGHRDVLGKPAREALPEVVGQGFLDLLDQVYETGEPFVGRAIPIRLQREPAGPLEERFLDFVYQPIVDARGAVTGIFAEGSDMTDRQLAENELRQLAGDLAAANRRQSEFLATLAHELRNPLAPIRTGLDLMRVRPDNPAALTRAYEMMDRQVDHLVHLVNDLLDIARVNTGKIALKKERALLKDIVLHAVETSLPAIEAKQLRFDLQMADELIWLEADSNRMAQVISNILVNAAKFTPERGKVTLSVQREASDVVITIADTGIGIPEGALSQIFDIFTQGEQGVDQGQGGLGIGLSLVKRLTEMHGGKVSAHSEGIGRGSRFVLRLPIVFDQPKPLTESAAETGAVTRNRRSLKILLVDDNEDAAVLLRDLLEIQGHVVRTAGNGNAGLDLAAQFTPDLALLDIGMPGMDGYELAGKLRNLAHLQGLTLVAITGWGTRNDQAKARAAGFHHHLTKPIQLKDIERILGGPADASATAA